MLRHLLVAVVLCAFSGALFGQTFEASASFGQSLFPGASKNLGTITQSPGDPQYTLNDGFSMALRMTLNSWRFMGLEFGYGYNHTSISIPSSAGTGNGGVIGLPIPGQSPQAVQKLSVPIHQGLGDFLVYATPEGTHVRPFAAGGLQFSSFFPPGTSAYYGNQTTKFGFNYGAGVKVRVTSIWGMRLDVRYYNTGKPFNLPNQTGRLQQLEITGGISFNLM